MENATQNQQIADAVGKPIARGPWYSASIAVNKARRSVSCTFPVSGPQGDGLLKFKAVRVGGDVATSVFRLLTFPTELNWILDGLIMLRVTPQ